VDIIPVYVGVDGHVLESSVDNAAHAVVIQALGAGNLNPSMFAAIEHALHKGIPIVIASRCWEGNAEPHYGYIGGGQTLAKIGACFAHDLPAHKARIYTQLLLSQASAKDKAIEHVRNGFAQLHTTH
jgi:L-asparaginase